MEYSEKLNKYIEAHSDSEPKVLADLNRYTHSHILYPRMLSGHLQGRVLAMLSRMIQPKFILEIGTFTGYSAICLSEGLQDSGKLLTVDINEELHESVLRYLEEAGVERKVEAVVGNAIEVIPTLKYDFDLVFIDADKLNYLNYYKLIIEKLKPGAYIIADNVLWSGKVIEEIKKNDKDTKAIMEFNDFVQNDARVSNVLFPVRDGLLVIQKIKD